MNNLELVDFTIKSSILDRPRILTINNEFVEYDDKEALSAGPTRILNSDIEAFRFGIRSIQGYAFYIGNIYCLDVKSKSGEVIKIRFNSLYGIRKKALNTKFSAIMDSLYETVSREMIKAYLQMFRLGADFEIYGAIFYRDGIQFHGRPKPISWDDMGTKAYYTYCAIFSKTDANYYKAFDYLSDWNSGIIFSLTREILIEKGLYK